MITEKWVKRKSKNNSNLMKREEREVGTFGGKIHVRFHFSIRYRYK